MVMHHRLLTGLLVAGLLSAPLVGAAIAAPAKPKPAPKPAAKADPKAGAKSFSEEGCSGCHKTKDHPSGTLGPDLSAIGGQKKPAEIAAYTRKPKTNSQMPAYRGPQKTLDNLVAYLMTQK